MVETVRNVNAQRLRKAPFHEFTGSSCQASELAQNPALKLDFIAAKPQMAHYMEISTKIYQIYLRYIAPEDIHVYSIDEVFMDSDRISENLSLHAARACHENDTGGTA